MDFVNTLMPIFLIVGIGTLVGRKGWFNEKHLEGFEYFIFKIALPCLLFNVTIKAKENEVIYWPYIFSYFCTFAIIMLIVNVIFKKDELPNKIIKTLASGYVNAGVYAVPVLVFLLKDAKAALLTNIIQITTINSLSMIMLSFILHKEQSSSIKRVINTFKSPFITMPILGILISEFDIVMPKFITDITTTFANCVSGMALFTYGMLFRNLNIKNLKTNADLKKIIFIKNLIHPLVAGIIGYFIFNLDYYWLLSLIVVASSPTAFIIYLMSKQYEVESETLSYVVTITSLFSLLALIVIYIAISIIPGF